MKKILAMLLLVLSFAVCKANQKEITAEVVFENLTGRELISGQFFITETNERIEIKGTQSFKITLPSKGKYQFKFTADDFNAYTYYPSTITNSKNTITIRLMEKTVFISGGTYSFPMNLETNLTDEQIERRIAQGGLNFIMFGINNSIPEEYVRFNEKYGIGLIKENCVIDPVSFKKATENNQMIFDYLNKKYGTSWLNELPSKPFGIK